MIHQSSFCSEYKDDYALLFTIIYIFTVNYIKYSYLSICAYRSIYVDNAVVHPTKIQVDIYDGKYLFLNAALCIRKSQKVTFQTNGS